MKKSLESSSTNFEPFRTNYIADIELYKHDHNLFSVDLERSLASPQTGHMANISLIKPHVAALVPGRAE